MTKTSSHMAACFIYIDNIYKNIYNINNNTKDVLYQELYKIPEEQGYIRRFVMNFGKFYFIFMVIVLIAGVTFYLMATWTDYRRNQFKRVFGFMGTTIKKNRTPGEQDVVNRVLITLADRFFAAANGETTISNIIALQRKKGVSDDEIITQLRETKLFMQEIFPHEKDIADIFFDIKRRVGKEKKRFWRAHTLAKIFGYEVAKSIKEYRSGGMM